MSADHRRPVHVDDLDDGGLLRLRFLLELRLLLPRLGLLVESVLDDGRDDGRLDARGRVGPATPGHGRRWHDLLLAVGGDLLLVGSLDGGSDAVRLEDPEVSLPIRPHRSDQGDVLGGASLTVPHLRALGVRLEQYCDGLRVGAVADGEVDGEGARVVTAGGGLGECLDEGGDGRRGGLEDGRRVEREETPAELAALYWYGSDREDS